MFRNISQRLISKRVREDFELYFRRISSYTHEVISTDDQNLFPPEDGVIQNSLYGQKINIPICTLDQYIWMDIDKFRHKTAIECGITGRSYTYEKLRDHCATFAVNILKKLHLSNKDTISVCLPNIPEFAIAAFGAIEAGLVLSTLNPIYTSDEIAKQLVNSNTKVLIGTVENYDTLYKAIHLSKTPIKLVMIKTEMGQSLPQHTIDFDDLLNNTNISYELLNNSRFDFNDTIMLPYSSGTTGLPKGVELTHRNFISNSEMISQDLGNERLIIETTDSHQDVLPCVLPYFHIYGWTCTLLSKLRLGCKLVTLPSFKPDTFMNVLINKNATVLHLVPPIVIYLSNSKDVTAEHLTSLRMIMSGAAPLGGSDVERFMEKAPQVKFSQGYGLTETSPVAMMQYIGSMNFASVGSSSPATQAKVVKLDDPEFTGVGPGITGEILVRGPHIMKGYYKNESATKETIIKNGWLRTGDIGYYDETKQFYITDRMKELIKVKGFQVAPAELEEVLRSHPHVADAAVIGVPNKATGELPRGYIVAKPNIKINEQDILNFVQDKVAVYKRLESVVVVSAIPKNATGKIMRRQLKQQYVLK